jgi:nucleoside 2-deoxyribosyltransferase
MTRRVYVATAFSRRAQARDAAAYLRGSGFMTTSGWHEKTHGFEMENHPDVRRTIAAQNIADLRAADAIVVLADADTAPLLRGTLIELATAHAWGHGCVVVGDRMDITLMADLRDVQFVPTLADAVRVLS